MRILALDASLARCAAAVAGPDGVLAARVADGTRRVAELPAMAAAVLAESGGRVDLVAVTVGPGSFTGIRAALALAHGVALGLCVPIVGVTIGEAMIEAAGLDGRALWTAIETGRGRIFLDDGHGVRSISLSDLPSAPAGLAIAGDAAEAVVAALAARGAVAILAGLPLPCIAAVARVGRRRASGMLPPIAVQPLYVDPPAVHAMAQRPPPAA